VHSSLHQIPDPAAFTRTDTVSAARCTTALDAAISVAPHAVRDRLEALRTAHTRRLPTAETDADAHRLLLDRAGKPLDHGRQDTYLAAARAVMAAAAACPCPAHDWTRHATAIDDQLVWLSHKIWAVTIDGRPVHDWNQALRHKHLFWHVDDWPDVTAVTVTWHSPVLTFTRHGIGSTVTLTALDRRQTAAYNHWWHRDPDDAAANRPACTITGTEPGQLAVAGRVYDLIRAAQHPWTPPYSTVHAAVTTAGLTGLTATDAEYLSGLAHGWDQPVSELLAAVTDLQHPHGQP
jgi:hypothetical protein